MDGKNAALAIKLRMIRQREVLARLAADETIGSGDIAQVKRTLAEAASEAVGVERVSI